MNEYLKTKRALTIIYYVRVLACIGFGAIVFVQIGEAMENIALVACRIVVTVVTLFLYFIQKLIYNYKLDELEIELKKQR